PCVVNCSTNPDAIICDDIETYNTGNISPQSAHWIPWDLNENSIVGSEVSTEQASNGTKSMKCRYQTGGGLQGDDQLLLLGEKTTGRYSLKWKMFVPTGKAAYFNVQGTELTPGTVFAIENYFLANSSIDITTNVRDTIPNAYPQNEWFQFEGVFDLNNNIAQFYINGNLYKSFPFTTNLGGIDFYCANNTYLFYLDEIEYVKLTDLTYNADDCATAVDLTPYFGGDLGTALTSGLYDNTSATTSNTDPVVDCWGESAGNDIIDHSMWFTFYGDGEQYHIETVPCNATNYIGTAQDDPGDTQMAIYTGSCGNYELVACNDDLFSNGVPDWRSAVDLLTTEGEQYYMLIDGFNFQGTVAIGQYCIQVSRGESVDCADAAVGTYGAANDAIVCNGASTNTALTLTAGSFTLPTVGEVKGMAWAISTADPAGEWPGTATGYWGSFPFSTEEYIPGLANDNDPLAYGEWWFTPVVIGNGVDGNAANGGAFVHDIDPSVACWVVGSSIKLTLLPPVDALSATYTSTNETLPPGNNGSISVTPAGGYAGLVGDVSLYNYTWSNGATTANLINIAGGSYTVTISDEGNCTPAIVLTVGVTTGVEDPSSVRSLVLSPNPTSGSMRMSLELENSSDVSVHIMNTLGQVMQSLEMGKVNGLKQDLNLANLPDGAYFLRVTIDGETAIRRVVVQR
ncbi:MAG: T9SS type A sorting domain-containing protein, partial [Saprospiraceae bacterium]|nr:T9SS type A sorting domain-containing protein [Saprospiraceae bacterium]